MSTETQTGLALLRVPFPANQISYIPKGGVKLAYVGHAALTDRLLDADPMWTWEPLAINPDGLPVFDGFGGMWIKLTICGVTRLGYGHAGNKEGGDAIKEIIGDALRNAAMRFGAALDLWHKGDLHADKDEPSDAAEPGSLEPILKASLKEATRTTIMKVRKAIREHIANERDLGALGEWQSIGRLTNNEEVADGVWEGLTTPEREKITELQNEAERLSKTAPSKLKVPA